MQLIHNRDLLGEGSADDAATTRFLSPLLPSLLRAPALLSDVLCLRSIGSPAADTACAGGGCMSPDGNATEYARWRLCEAAF